MIGDYRSAKIIAPGWQIRMQQPNGDDWQWPVVAFIVTTEADDGRKLIRFLCEDGRHGQAYPDDDVFCRTPEEIHQAVQETAE
ncbi:hypothetical protein OG339_47850 (plasmid) [Streptosporangium sp. NBC_01495]|uniref:hypothetical protein n=1 Tax=Streptosporangium sp. NBC_01495 TaxID=2903899 RepID=UPI002E3234A7|nr:hypothetical protein [Streptosporangium sp. NBC_01495]